MNRRDLIPSEADVLLIDGLNLAFKSAYTLSRLKAGDEATGVIYGMLNSIFTSLQKFMPRAVFVVWEGRNSKARRKKLYSQYKEGRKSDLDTESIFAQVDIVEDILLLAGAGVVKEDTYEADDSIATLCSFGNSTVIVSSDNDLLQLVSPTVSRYNVGQKQLVTLDNFAKETGLSFPIERYVDYKVLVGDSSDNISGVSGVGKVTAAKLLSEWDLDEYIATGEPSVPRTTNIFDSVAVIEQNRSVIDLKWNQTEERRLNLLDTIRTIRIDMDEVFAMLEDYEMWTLLDNAEQFESVFKLLETESVVEKWRQDAKNT